MGTSHAFASPEDQRIPASGPAKVSIQFSWSRFERAMTPDDEPIRIPVTDVFDLHSVQPKETAAAVEAYLEEARRLGLKSLRIIHGRGIGVQRRIVQAVLARTPFVASYADAPPEAGGWGATVITLR